jgi:DNA-binding ferritin-like protein
LYAHNAHHLASGPTFFADHEFLGDTYEEYTEAYDSVVELIIGDSGSGALDLVDVQTKAATMVAQMGEDGDTFPVLYRGEALLQSSVNNIGMGNADQGVLQVIGSIAQESKKRRYKIGQRIKP